MDRLLSKILIVEDNPFDFQFTKKLLKKRNQKLKITGAVNIGDAVELINFNNYDLIFLDLNLPDSSGLDSLSSIISCSPNLPIIILTSNDDKETAIKALKTGAQDYLIKGEISSSLLERSIRYSFERKQSADKLKNHNNFLLSVIESLTHPFIVIDAETKNIDMANSAAAALNFKENICCFLSHGESWKCDSISGVCPVEEVKRTKKPVTINHSFKTFEGDNIINEIHGFPLFNENGKLRQIILYLLDISEREKTKLKNEMLSTVVHQSSDSIMITDKKGTIEYVNPAFQKITGFSLEEIKGQNRNILESGRNEKKVYDSIRKKLSEGKSWNGDIVSRKKSGSFFEEKIRISPIKDKNNNIVTYVSVSTDITKEKRLESIAEAANLMTNIGYIFSGIRHEIGNPINSIKLALTVLNNNLEKYSLEKIQEFTRRTLEEILRVEYLLKALKNFSLFETPDTRPVNLNAFIKNFVNLISNDFMEKNIRIRSDIPPQNISAHTDPRALHQVLLNLFTNAADALEEVENPKIIISLKLAESLAVIEVIDNGCGMDKEEQSNLFKPFYTSKSYGTGLGLVIVKKMLAKMQSNIKIKSRKKEGTSVFIFIPEADGEHNDEK